MSARPHLAIVPQWPAYETFVAQRRAMLEAWRALVADGDANAEDLADEITGTTNAMRMLMGLCDG